MVFLRIVGACFAILLATQSALAQIITVDTSAFASTEAQLAFDFIDGGNPNNNIKVLQFVTNGQLGASTSSGAVSGTLLGGLTFADDSFFNEYLTDIKLGSSFSFLLAATAKAPEAASFPDTFSMFLLASETGLPLFATSDPTGAGSLFSLEIDGRPHNTINLYSSNATIIAVPEPATFWLFLAGIGFLMQRVGNKKGGGIW